MNFILSDQREPKDLSKNAEIIRLKDENDPSFDYSTLYDTVQTSSYQFRLNLAGAHYFPLSRASTPSVRIERRLVSESEDLSGMNYFRSGDKRP